MSTHAPRMPDLDFPCVDPSVACTPVAEYERRTASLRGALLYGVLPRLALTVGTVGLLALVGHLLSAVH